MSSQPDNDNNNSSSRKGRARIASPASKEGPYGKHDLPRACKSLCEKAYQVANSVTTGLDWTLDTRHWGIKRGDERPAGKGMYS